eukprot:13906913-Alexandrium_andersonii.AAC.1
MNKVAPEAAQQNEIRQFLRAAARKGAQMPARAVGCLALGALELLPWAASRAAARRRAFACAPGNAALGQSRFRRK